MLTVNKAQVQLIDGKLMGEASEMVLAPGEWPDFIAVVDDAGKGLLFPRGILNGGAVHYHDRATGVELLVVND